jgi:hypothetical protein
MYGQDTMTEDLLAYLATSTCTSGIELRQNESNYKVLSNKNGSLNICCRQFAGLELLFLSAAFSVGITYLQACTSTHDFKITRFLHCALHFMLNRKV